MQVGRSWFPGDSDGFFYFTFENVEAYCLTKACVENTTRSPRINEGFESLGRWRMFGGISNLDIYKSCPILATFWVRIILVCEFQT